MLLQDNLVKIATPHHSLAEQAKALALILQEEFGVPFAFFDVASGEEVWGRASSADLPTSAVIALADEGQATVIVLPDGRYRVALVLYESGKPILVAAGVVAAHGGSRGERDCEVERLQKWVQAVSDRLRLMDQLLSKRRLEEEQNAQLTLAWGAIHTLDRLVRCLGIDKNPEKNQKRILEAAFSLLRVRALLWIPGDVNAPVVMHGELPAAPPDCRELTETLTQSPDYRPGKPVLCNRVPETEWGARFPYIDNLLAFEVTDQGALGWLIALNKGRGTKRVGSGEWRVGSGTEESGAPAEPQPAPLSPLATLHSHRGFRREDAALLMPFAGLMDLHARGSSRYEDLKELLVGLTRALTSALDAKDSHTFGHSERVARIAVELGRELGLSADELNDIYLAGLLHDVGKIGVPDAVLNKPGPLTPEEFEHIKQHTLIGYRILADLRPIRRLLPGVLYHHERYDGKGYPDGLAGENIPLLARVLAVADGYDAMTTARAYREPMSCRRVEQILNEAPGCNGTSRWWMPSCAAGRRFVPSASRKRVNY